MLRNCCAFCCIVSQDVVYITVDLPYNGECMGEEKAKNKKVTKALILGALVLYVIFGGISLGYYYKVFYAAPVRSSEADEESSKMVNETVTETVPAPTKAVVPTQAPKEPYDTDEGNAGAARDLDIE